MPLTTTTELLRRAQQGGYAVGAFNVENMEMMQAVIEAAEAAHAPVILQTTPSTLRYAPPELFQAMAARLAGQAAAPVALHLDHGNSFELARRAIDAGYTSVMIDASQKPWEDNVRLTRQVTETAAAFGVPVEAELGTVGGKEDDLSAEGDAYTDPQQARQFVEETGVSSLAVAIGTAHGVYHGVPRLDVDRLRRIRAAVAAPLVLHGASGLSDDSVRECIRAGICKVNFATELRLAYTRAVRELLQAEPEAFDPKAYGARARDAVRAQVQERMAVCGCLGKA